MYLAMHANTLLVHTYTYIYVYVYVCICKYVSVHVSGNVKFPLCMLCMLQEMLNKM